ncbi:MULTISPECIES: GlxA family transcriptional regulator [unclassified Marinobacter]|uniref:GlxA family transcriptional regulator n=1 Tax=unclassified Marinobacter TaxID=83889 RepID=UPI0019266C1E|nr:MULTISPECIES: helix-turn-helix domain-containing protein [unclassified Marinobacter]MBL3824286.1 helix-turn-helix domain-containing protein [Marinobacter sp. MC3]MBL3892622.1 helix-turn-helix domain-containing protein [Marinobacter sp. MW3]
MKIGLLLYSDCIPSGLFAFSDLLNAANLRMGSSVFEWCWLSLHGQPVSCANGLELSAGKLENAEVDALLIPGAWRDQSSIHSPKDASLVQALKALGEIRFKKQGKKPAILSYCTGVYLAASSGRLNHQTATTTWWLLDTIREQFPDVQWQLNRTFVMDEDNATAAGVNGHLPIALSLIEKHCGKQVASEIQQYMVLPRPVERNTPFQKLPELIQQNAFVREVFHWVEQTPYTRLKTTALADHLHITQRTLSRKIDSLTGYNTAQLMRLIKLNQISEQLISTNKSIYQISDELGFADDTSLRRSFKRITNMTPGEYRQAFG